MNGLDFVLALLIVVSIVGGLRSGFVQVAIGFAAAVVGFVAASQLYGVAGAALSPLISSATVAALVGFLIVFCVVLLAGAVVTRVIQGFLKLTGLSLFDRAAGGAFGLVRGVLIGSVIVMALLAFSPAGPPKLVATSALAPYVVEGSRAVAQITPRKVREEFNLGYQRLRRYWNGSSKGTNV